MIFINSNQLIKMINQGRLTLIIDVRDEEQYTLGHIPNSINMPIDIIQDNIDKLYLYKNEPILIYCSNGQISAIVGKYLEKQGFYNIYNLLNGVDNYKIKN